MSVLLNLGKGTFAARVDYVAGANPNSVASADMNGDGRADLVTANWSGGNVSVLLNQGNGTFAAPSWYSASPDPGSVVALDLNADGRVDLAVAGFYARQVSVLLATCAP